VECAIHSKLGGLNYLKYLLRHVQNLVLATTNHDLSAHTAPLSCNFHILRREQKLALFFWSFPCGRTTKNMYQHPERPIRVQLLRTEDNFGALALRGFGIELSLDEIAKELPTFNKRRAKLAGLGPRELHEFTDPEYPKAMHRIDFHEAELPVRAYDPVGRWAGDGAVVLEIGQLLSRKALRADMPFRVG
jgi:hypothetical protein